METTILEVLGVFKGSSENSITKAPERAIHVDWDGIVGDQRHRGDVRGTGGYSCKWSAGILSEIETMKEIWNRELEERGIKIPPIGKIDPSWLGFNIIFSEFPGFTSKPPHVFKFPSGFGCILP